MSATFLETITIGISFEGLVTMIWSYWMIKGLLNRSNVLRILVYIENGSKIIFYGLIFFGFMISISSGNYPTLAKTIGIGDVFIFELYDWWGIPVSGILLLLSIFIIYVLSRRDVRELFKSSDTSTTTPAPTPSAQGDTPGSSPGTTDGGAFSGGSASGSWHLPCRDISYSPHRRGHLCYTWPYRGTHGLGDHPGAGPGGPCGGGSGARLMMRVPARQLRWIFGIFLMVVGSFMIITT